MFKAFKVKWRGYADCTWEPLSHFVVPTQTTPSGKRLQENVEWYMKEHRLLGAQEEARRLLD